MLDNLTLELREIEMGVSLEFNANDGLSPFRRLGQSGSYESQPREGQQHNGLKEVPDV